MILGIGIDTVNIDRFEEYQHKTQDALLKLFSATEIAYCLSKPHPATHFASHFAAREAFFKAYQGLLAHYNQDHPATLLTINKNITLLHTPSGLPYIKVDWQTLLPTGITVPTTHVSITHTNDVATAIVMLI